MSGVERMKEYERRLHETAIPITHISGSGKVHVKDVGDIRISGSGFISPEEIRISGSGSLPGGMKVKRVDCSGSVSVGGDVEVEEMRVSGSASVAGNVKAKTVSASGSISIDGEVKGSYMRASGSCDVGRRIELDDVLRASGSLRVSGDVIVKNAVRLSGCFNIDGKVITNIFEVELSRWESNVRGGIEAVDVSVKRKRIEELALLDIPIIGRICRRVHINGRLSTTDIVAKGRVCLENVSCDNVCGRDVIIGEGCVIKGKVRYSKSISVHPVAMLASPPEKSQSIKD